MSKHFPKLLFEGVSSFGTSLLMSYVDEGKISIAGEEGITDSKQAVKLCLYLQSRIKLLIQPSNDTQTTTKKI